jgi:hypothetical protein
MGISEYENIEIFNKTQSFTINKYENQILRQPLHEVLKILKILISSFQMVIVRFKGDKLYI